MEEESPLVPTFYEGAHINVPELCAAFLALGHYMPYLWGQIVLVKTDSSKVVAQIIVWRSTPHLVETHLFFIFHKKGLFGLNKPASHHPLV